MRITVAALVCLMGCVPQDNPLGSLDGGGGGGDGGNGGDGGQGAPLKPNVMLLIDKSGSMNFPANDQSPCTPGCNQAGNPACVAGCRTRVQELKSAMSGFLANNGSKAWMGMAIYPTAVAGGGGVVDACGATTSADIRVQLSPQPTDLPAEMMAAATAIDAQIQALAIGGGTPTGDSLKFLGTYTPLLGSAREDYVVLITDGVPNCNANNPNTCNNVTACKCTLIPATSCMPASFCSQGCLDADSSVAQIAALRLKGIKTIVIGFGAETASGDGPATLDAMAEAGGFTRGCPGGMDAECGAGNTCNATTRLCSQKYYQASTSLELQSVLVDIFKVP